MVVGKLKICFKIEYSASLKDKRRINQKIVQRLKNKYNISIAVLENTNVLNYSEIGIALVSNEVSHIKKMIQKIENEFYDTMEILITSFDVDIDVEN